MNIGAPELAILVVLAALLGLGAVVLIVAVTAGARAKRKRSDGPR